MSNVNDWAVAIDLQRDQEGVPLLGSVVAHIRNAVIEGGFITRGRITSGLKEACRPLGVDEEQQRRLIDEALQRLLLGGDIDELLTGAGRAYAATPPRRVKWDGATDIILGATNVSSKNVVRRIGDSENTEDMAVTVTIQEELGRPVWRDVLVELGGIDQPDADASALSEFAHALTTSGSRYSLDEPKSVSVLSGRSEFFGSADPPTGRWRRVESDGFYPANIPSGYTRRYVLLDVRGREAALWQPASRDIWNWIVVGYTLTAGEPVLRYDRAEEKLDFLTPPPTQMERAALLMGNQLSSWSWRVDEQAHHMIASLMGRPH